jgi:ERF superfamily
MRRIPGRPAPITNMQPSITCATHSSPRSANTASHSWKMNQEGQWIKVTCILTHELGHSEETTLMGAPDNSGSKNAIQAVGSTVTYLERYTLLAACGLSTKGSDNDGRGAVAGSGIPRERVLQLCASIANSPNIAELHRRYPEAGHAAQAANDRNALSAPSSRPGTRESENCNEARSPT